jgi:hypothetical protein
VRGKCWQRPAPRAHARVLQTSNGQVQANRPESRAAAGVVTGDFVMRTLRLAISSSSAGHRGDNSCSGRSPWPPQCPRADDWKWPPGGYNGQRSYITAVLTTSQFSGSGAFSLSGINIMVSGLVHKSSLDAFPTRRRSRSSIGIKYQKAKLCGKTTNCFLQYQAHPSL